MAKSVPTRNATLLRSVCHRTAMAATAVMGVLMLLLPASASAAAAGYSYTSKQPPGTANVSTLLDYVFWGVGLAGVLGILGLCAMISLAHFNGRGAGEHVGKLGAICAAMIGAGMAGSIVSTLL